MGACTRAERYQYKTKTWIGVQKIKPVSFLQIHKFLGQDRLFCFSEQLENCVAPFFFISKLSLFRTA